MNYSQCIRDLKDDFDKVQEQILPNDPSTAQNISVHLSKMLILTCASTYEQRLQNAYISYAAREAETYGDRPNRFDYDRSDRSVYQKFNFGYIESSSDDRVLPGVKKTLEPLKFFGNSFLNKILEEIEGNSVREQQVRAFSEIFTIRNLIAHQTFVEFASNKVRGKSFQDIVNLHKDADEFVTYLEGKFS